MSALESREGAAPNISHAAAGSHDAPRTAETADSKPHDGHAGHAQENVQGHAQGHGRAEAASVDAAVEGSVEESKAGTRGASAAAALAGKVVGAMRRVATSRAADFDVAAFRDHYARCASCTRVPRRPCMHALINQSQPCAEPSCRAEWRTDLGITLYVPYTVYKHA